MTSCCDVPPPFLRSCLSVCVCKWSDPSMPPTINRANNNWLSGECVFRWVMGGWRSGNGELIMHTHALARWSPIEILNPPQHHPTNNLTLLLLLVADTCFVFSLVGFTFELPPPVVYNDNHLQKILQIFFILSSMQQLILVTITQSCWMW